MVRAKLWIIVALCCGVVQPICAEQISLPNGVSVEIPEGVPPEVRQKLMEDAMKGAGKPSKKENGEGKKEEGDGKDKGKDKKEKGDKKKDDGKPEAVTRPDKPEKDPDASELKAMPKDGKLVLQFMGHPWPAMIQWYSRATGREVEWQELPSGYVNLRTQRAFTLDETGDLLNRLLLARGYTMLDDGEFIQVLKTEGMNPAFVPRIEPRQLATRQPHSFVRVSFQLQRLKADELAKELEAMKSKHGKLVPMTAANRIEAMDTVRNLRDIYSAIDAEQSSGNRAPREFQIEFMRAEKVKTKLEEMFSKPAAPMTPEQMQQMQQQMQQRRNRGGGNQEGQQPKKPNGDPAISIVVNEFRNSVIVKAEPNVMIDIAASIKLLDVPSYKDDLDIKAYTLSTRSPTEVAEILNESGALSPTSIVRVDKKTKALLLSGTALDHLRIEELIKKIDGNARRFERIRLRRYPAAQVATTIENMMGKPKEEKNNRRRYYSYWDTPEEEDDNPNDVFKVTADVENNNLILKCNDAEYEMVIDLLTQMGEVMTRSKFASNEIVLDGISTEDDLLERVRQVFNATSDNQVVLPPPVVKAEASDEAEEGDETEADGSEEAPDDQEATTREVRTTNTQRPLIEFVGTNESAIVMVDDHYTDIIPANSPYVTLLTGETTPKQNVAQHSPSTAVALREPPKKNAPPVIIRRNGGKIVIRCDDPVALEKFEEILRQMAPPAQDWVSFRMKHVTALWMKLQLKDFFDEDDDEQQNMFIWDYWGNDDKDDPPPGLGDQRKMRFIDDGESTLVVRNASAKQLATVKELIALYDVAEPPNDQNGRFKEIIRIKHSKARVIETAIKDALRDLLSSNDKAFAQQEGSGEGEGRGRRMGPFSFSDTSTSVLQGTSFKGKISFGVDETTNSLIVTAEGKELLKLVVGMVNDLDVAAVTIDDTRVMAVPEGVSTGSLRETLTRVFGADSVTTQKPNGQEGQEGNEGNEGGPEGEGRRGRRGRQN